MPENLKLLLVFAKIGVMTFGGGYAMIPLLMRETVTVREWISAEEFSDCTAIGQSTPGVIAVNIATYIGYKRARIAGSLFATVGVIFPSVVIIGAIAALLSEYRQIPVVSHAFAGVRVCVCALIVKTVAALWKVSVPDVTRAVIFAVVLLLSVFLKIPPALLAVASVVFGVMFARLRKTKK